MILNLESYDREIINDSTIMTMMIMLSKLRPYLLRCDVDQAADAVFVVFLIYMTSMECLLRMIGFRRRLTMQMSVSAQKNNNSL